MSCCQIGIAVGHLGGARSQNSQGKTRHLQLACSFGLCSESRRAPFTARILDRCEQIMQDVCTDADAELHEFKW